MPSGGLETVKLKPSIQRWIGGLILGLGLAAASHYILREYIVDWQINIIVVIGAACALVSISRLIGTVLGLTYLELTPNGLRQKTLSSSKFWAWQDIDNFCVRTTTVNGQDSNKSVQFFDQSKWTAGITGGKVNTTLRDTFGLEAEQLAALLYVYRDKAVTMHAAPARMTTPQYSPTVQAAKPVFGRRKRA